MSKLKKPKLTGMKIFCTTCCSDNPTCKHFDKHAYRMRLHVKGSGKGIRSKTLVSRDYDTAVDEAIAFKKEMLKSDFQPKKSKKQIASKPLRHTLVTAILKYDQYLGGQHELVHLRKIVSDAHRKEMIRFCIYFTDAVKKTDNVQKLALDDITQHHVASFYQWAEDKFAPKTFNKAMAALKAFFEFAINIEKVKIDNPFAIYNTKSAIKRQVQTLSQQEFLDVLYAVDNADPVAHLGNEIKKNRYYPYLKHAFRLFLLTGGRREEVVELKWSDIMITVQQVRFFQVANRKVQKQRMAKNSQATTADKYFPINADLQQLLDELGFETYKGQNRYILYPERTVSTNTIMNRISASFTHYRKAAGIEKEVSLDELRKTYLTWMNVVMNSDTKVLSSHTSDNVLQVHYYDPKILSTIEKAALEFRVFGG
jgi:integrase